MSRSESGVSNPYTVEKSPLSFFISLSSLG